MFHQHPSFLPIDADRRVWRYLDFTKFIALLESQALWFARPRTFRDPWELALTRKNLERLAPGLPDRDAIAGMITASDAFFVNCWHVNDTESAAMWDLYLPSGQGVAIQSTWERLTTGLPGEPNVYGGAVRYLDYEADDTWDESNIFFPVGTKRLSFAHEQEARLVVWAFEAPGTLATNLDSNVAGIRVPIDLERVVERVVIAPGSPAWFKDLVRRVAQVLSFTGPIGESDMDAEPITLARLLDRMSERSSAEIAGQGTERNAPPSTQQGR